MLGFSLTAQRPKPLPAAARHDANAKILHSFNMVGPYSNDNLFDRAEKMLINNKKSYFLMNVKV
jgi:hypothetical protein